MMDISIPYYEDLTRISNSNIGWFLNKGPAFLHKMLTNPPPEEKNSTLERGTMIHEYLLQPEEFQKDYVVWDKRRPSSTQQEKFCQELANSAEIEPNKALLSAYRASYSTTNKAEEKMLSEASKIASELKEYIDFLKSNDKRKMISPWDVKMLETIRHNIESHKLASKIIWFVGYGSYPGDSPVMPGDKMALWHEFHINWEWDNGIKCKSLLDGLTLDFENKKATIYDLKTTQKLWHFEESVEMYDYCRQLCYYKMAVMWYLEKELGEDLRLWDFDFYIIGIDTTGSYEIRVFKVLGYSIRAKEPTIKYALEDIYWHQQNNKWDHSRAYYEGDGSEQLNL